jgi:hypothetical protein
MAMEEEMSDSIKWETRRLTHSIKQYLEHHCWLVGLLATRLHQQSAVSYPFWQIFIIL